MPLKYKLKGCYWTPDPLDYTGSIANAQPPCWYKDLGNAVSVRAAVAHMLYGADIEQYIRMCYNPYDFMCAVKTRGTDVLMWNGKPQQKRATRYYLSKAGHPMTKEAPALGVPGTFKKASGVSDAEYARVMAETGGAWDERVCTKNKSRYEPRINQVHAGYKVKVCNNVRDFDFSDVDYSWYIQEAVKLVV